MDQTMKSLSKKIAAFLIIVPLIMMANIQTVLASVITYNVTGVFYEPQTQPLDTIFNGSFDWDGSVVSNIQGTMNSSMYATDNINPTPGLSYPLMNLSYQLTQSTVGNIVTATVFKENTTNVFSGLFGGGFEAGGGLRYGNSPAFGQPADGNMPNYNAYFTLAFDKTSMEGVIDSMVYADCTEGGMMGQICMTAHSVAKVGYAGTMGGIPSSLTISAVPVPAAVWLFGSALLGLAGISRKRDNQI